MMNQTTNRIAPTSFSLVHYIVDVAKLLARLVRIWGAEHFAVYSSGYWVCVQRVDEERGDA